MARNIFGSHDMSSAETGAVKKHRGINTYNILVLCFLCLGSITYGYSASVISTTLGQPQFIKYFALDTRADGLDLEATMNGLYQAGGVLGPFLLPWFADKLGRKWAIAIAAIIQTIAAAVMCGSVNVGMFVAFRFFAGASAFMLLAAVPLLMNEIVPSHLRGSLVDLHGVSLVLGYTIQGWIGFGFFFWNGGSNTWRPTIGISAVWPLLLLAGLPWMPESPRWLCMVGREAEAEKILTKLHQAADDPENEVAQAEFYQIKKQIAIDKTLGSSWMHIIKKPSYRKRALLAIGTTGIIQCGGVLVIANYGPSLYAKLGFSPVKQLLYPAAWLTFSSGTNIIGMFLVDRFPRPKYMAAGIIMAEVTLMVEAALVANFQSSNNQAALQAAVAMFFIYQVFYGAMLDGTQFSYIGEMFPTHIRAKGICLGVSMISLMNVMWLQAAPTAFANIGWRYYLPFIIAGTLGGLIMWFFFPDTSHRPLEEVAAIFGDQDEVAIYSEELEFNPTTHSIVTHDTMKDSEKALHLETSETLQ